MIDFRTEASVAQAGLLGKDHGKAVGSWVIDGNTSKEFCEKLIQGEADGDPEVMDMCPMPLSGEWADSLTPESLCKGLGYTDEQVGDLEWQCDTGDSIVEAYEQGFTLGWWTEVIQRAYGQHGDYEPCPVCKLYGHGLQDHIEDEWMDE